MAGIALLALALAGCSLTFDDNQLVPVPEGDPPARGDNPIIPSRSEALAVVEGADGALWLSMFTGGPFTGERVRVVRREPPADEEEIAAPAVWVTRHAFYLVEPRPDGPVVTIRRAGAAAPDRVIKLPKGAMWQRTGADGDVFAWSIGNLLHVERRDGSAGRDLAFRDPFGRSLLGQWAFDDRGELVFGWMACTGRGPPSAWCGHVMAYPVAGPGRRILPLFTSDFRQDAAHRALISCEPEGVRSAPYDGSPPRILAPSCVARAFSMGLLVANGSVYYAVDTHGPAETRYHYRAVLLDGSEPERELLDRSRAILAIGRDEVAWSPPSDETAFSSEGWIGDWRFMERGRGVQFSRLARRVRWIEHTALSPSVGDLMAADVPGGAAVRLAYNVRRFDELADGRLLVADHAAFTGSHNEVVVIDEERRTSRWVAGGANGYDLIPGSSDVIVHLVNDAREVSLQRVAVPPR